MICLETKIELEEETKDPESLSNRLRDFDDVNDQDDQDPLGTVHYLPFGIVNYYCAVMLLLSCFYYVLGKFFPM